jgi:acetyl-CoA carboxylase carboxyltransferase component
MATGSFVAPVATMAWPTGEMGGMGLEGAVRLGFRRELEAIADDNERAAAESAMIKAAYEHGRALNVAAHLEIDDVIDPAETRARITALLAAAEVPSDVARPARLIDPF